MPHLDSGLVTKALELDIPLAPVVAAETTFGSPAQGDVILDTTPGQVIGVWEMTPGDLTERELAEVVVILKGRVTVDFPEPGPDGGMLPSVELRPGSILRVHEGMLTCWTVHETVRKVFIRP